MFGGEAAFNANHSSLLVVAGKLWLTYIEPTKKNAMGNLCALEINPETLEAGEPVVIAREEDMAKSLNTKILVSIIPSPDGKKQLILIGNSSGDFYLAGLNNQWVTEWKGKFELAGYKMENLASIVLDNEGMAYLSAVDQKKKKAGLYVVKKGRLSPEKPFTLDNAVINNLEINNANNGESMIIGGTYCEGSEYVNHVFSGFLKKDDLSTNHIEKLAIPKEIIDIADDYAIGSKKKKAGIYPVCVHAKVVQISNLKPTLIIECMRSIFTATTQYGVAANIIVVNFNAIPKDPFIHIPRYSFLSRTHDEMEYHFSVCPDKLAIGYIDNADNLGKTANDKYKVLNGDKNAGYFLFTLTDKGETRTRLHELSRDASANAEAGRAMNTVCEPVEAF